MLDKYPLEKEIEYYYLKDGVLTSEKLKGTVGSAFVILTCRRFINVSVDLLTQFLLRRVFIMMKRWKDLRNGFLTMVLNFPILNYAPWEKV